MNVPWVNLNQTPSRNFDPWKDMSFVGRAYFPSIAYGEIFKIIFSKSAHMISTKFHLNTAWLNLDKIASRNFDLIENITFFGRQTCVILASGAIQAIIDL